MTGWCAEWSTSLVAIDPRSLSATLLDPLRDAVGKHRVRPVDTIGMAVAHGRFQDRLTAGRLRVRGHTALDLAARQAQERRLAGAQAVDRYRGSDPAALVTAELAVWPLDEANYDTMNSVW